MKISFTKDYIFETIQGEGKFVGVPSIFMRLSGCNLRCEWKNPDGSVTPCDTPYSSHQPEKNLKDVEEAVFVARRLKAKHVVVTGGEPFLQPGVVALINELVCAGKYVTVETNGTIYRQTMAQFYSISPKLSSSTFKGSKNYAKHEKARSQLDQLAQFVKHPHQLKFVVNTPEDLAEIENILAGLKTLNGSYDERNVYLMPQGTSVEQFDAKADWIVQECKKRDWNFTDRLHVRLWGHKRGV